MHMMPFCQLELFLLLLPGISGALPCRAEAKKLPDDARIDPENLVNATAFFNDEVFDVSDEEQIYFFDFEYELTINFIFPNNSCVPKRFVWINDAQHNPNDDTTVMLDVNYQTCVMKRPFYPHLMVKFKEGHTIPGRDPTHGPSNDSACPVKLQFVGYTNIYSVDPIYKNNTDTRRPPEKMQFSNNGVTMILVALVVAAVVTLAICLLVLVFCGYIDCDKKDPVNRKDWEAGVMASKFSYATDLEAVHARAAESLINTDRLRNEGLLSGDSLKSPPRKEAAPVTGISTSRSRRKYTQETTRLLDSRAHKQAESVKNRKSMNVLRESSTQMEPTPTALISDTQRLSESGKLLRNESGEMSKESADQIVELGGEDGNTGTRTKTSASKIETRTGTQTTSTRMLNHPSPWTRPIDDGTRTTTTTKSVKERLDNTQRSSSSTQKSDPNHERS